MLWLVPAVFYALFVYWYTDFGGPLSEEEIAVFSEQLRAGRDVDDNKSHTQKRERRDATPTNFALAGKVDGRQCRGQRP